MKLDARRVDARTVLADIKVAPATGEFVCYLGSEPMSIASTLGGYTTLQPSAHGYPKYMVAEVKAGSVRLHVTSSWLPAKWFRLAKRYG